MKTRTEITDEISKLEALQGRLRMSAFGDDNNAALDVQLAVLRGEIYEDDIDSEYSEFEASNARDAVAWLEGDYDAESLAAEWEPLARPAKGTGRFR